MTRSADVAHMGLRMLFIVALGVGLAKLVARHLKGEPSEAGILIQFQNYFRVYDREGEPCKTCGTKIKRMTVGQRGTHFCPTCQTRRSAA